jgi:hypothetical protein
MLKAKGLPVMDSESHILPVMVGDARKCKALTDSLLHEYKFYLQPINYPTVPVGAERIRITPGPFHTEEQLERLTSAIDELWSRLDLPRRSPSESCDADGPQVVASSLPSAPSLRAVLNPGRIVDEVIMDCVGHHRASPRS